MHSSQKESVVRTRSKGKGKKVYEASEDSRQNKWRVGHCRYSPSSLDFGRLPNAWMAYEEDGESFDRKIANINVSERLRIGMLSHRTSTGDIMNQQSHISRNEKFTYYATHSLLDKR